jgi:PAS domain S-box-containing protein
LIALISGVTDLRRATRLRGIAERGRAESESTTRALFEAAAQAIFIVRQGGTIVMANPAAEKILGYSRKELLGSSIEMLIPEGLRNVHRNHRMNYFENPQNRAMGQGLDLHARRKDGSEFFADISLSYIKTATETLGVAFLTDISKRRADEQAIRDQKDDLRRLAANLMTAQDDERRRIARDLHDETSQKLAYLAMDAGKLAAISQDEELMNRLRLLQKRATEASDSVRRISHRLHPSILDDIGLEAAIEQYCEEFQERSGIATDFSSTGVPADLSTDVASSVYHIFQECLRNVSKHAKTERVMVTLEGSDDYLRLTVKDQGIGLSDTQQKSGTTIGLTGMKERALLINATLTIRSQSGEGTEVTVAVPLSA